MVWAKSIRMELGPAVVSVPERYQRWSGMFVEIRKGGWAGGDKCCR